MRSCRNIVFLLFIYFVLGAAFIDGEPEPMARPTRPKVFTSPEELRRYLDLVRDYYSLNGKARYGKRGDVSSSPPEVNHPWDALRTLLDIRRQMQQQKFEDGMQESGQLVRDFQASDLSKHDTRIDARPMYVLDVLRRKYQDDVQ